eukprot:1630024-Pleurochrysis_carterae.AAC.2
MHGNNAWGNARGKWAERKRVNNARERCADGVCTHTVSDLSQLGPRSLQSAYGAREQRCRQALGPCEATTHGAQHCDKEGLQKARDCPASTSSCTFTSERRRTRSRGAGRERGRRAEGDETWVRMAWSRKRRRQSEHGSASTPAGEGVNQGEVEGVGMGNGEGEGLGKG